MEKTYTLADMVAVRFEATKQRGKYLAHIVRELDRAGVKEIDGVLKRAIFEFGKQKSSDWGSLTPREFVEHLMGEEVARGTMGFTGVGASTDEWAEFTFARCPLEDGWREMGLSARERDRLCRIAREHDFGIVDNDPELQLQMQECIGSGDPTCRLVVTKKTR